MSEVDFSIIIPAFNEAANIQKCLESVSACRKNGFSSETIVVDNGSTDDTAAIARASGVRVEINAGPRLTISSLRNRGAQMSSGKYLVFLDADMVAPSNWLVAAGAYFKNGFQGMFGFVDKVPDEAGPLAKAWGNKLFIKRDKVVEVDFLRGRNLFINRSVFFELGGFDESLTTAEDKDLTLRAAAAGYRVFSSPEAPVIHLGHEKNLKEFIAKEYWRQGGALGLFLKKKTSFRTLRHPLLCLWHVVMPLAFLFVLLAGHAATALLFLFFWPLPAALQTLLDLRGKGGPGLTFQLLFLTFLRWHIAALALAVQTKRMLIKKTSGQEHDHEH
ncbi:MAG: glycosyltransferase [Pseudomonadota bacterium]